MTDSLMKKAAQLIGEGIDPDTVCARLDVPRTTFDTWRATEPSFDAEVRAARAKAINDRDAKMQQDAEIHFFGGQR